MSRDFSPTKGGEWKLGILPAVMTKVQLALMAVAQVLLILGILGIRVGQPLPDRQGALVGLLGQVGAAGLGIQPAQKSVGLSELHVIGWVLGVALRQLFEEAPRLLVGRFRQLGAAHALIEETQAAVAAGKFPLIR